MVIEILRAAMYIAAGLDLGTTWKGMSLGQREANPILGQNRIRQAALVLGSVIFTDLMMRWALGQGEILIAVIGYAIIGAIHAVPAILNLRRIW